MTGYANASASPAMPASAALHEPQAASPAAGSIGVEMRSVNNRFLDLSLRLPDEYRSLEPALREMVTGRFKRGKIELRLSGASDADEGHAEPQPEQLAHVARIDREVRELLG